MLSRTLLGSSNGNSAGFGNAAMPFWKLATVPGILPESTSQRIASCALAKPPTAPRLRSSCGRTLTEPAASANRRPRLFWGPSDTLNKAIWARRFASGSKLRKTSASSKFFATLWTGRGSAAVTSYRSRVSAGSLTSFMCSG